MVIPIATKGNRIAAKQLPWIDPNLGLNFYVLYEFPTCIVWFGFLVSFDGFEHKVHEFGTQKVESSQAFEWH